MPRKKIDFRPDAAPEVKKTLASIGTPAKKPFTPDPYQIKAVEAVRNSDCLVSAPTGAGKTWIAEQVIRDVHLKGGRAWYATPLKALTNAKLSEFSSTFGAEQVGILTGDRKENSDASIIVGTTEILRNAIFENEELIRDVEYVVFDEVHSSIGEQLEKIVADLPAVESLHDDEARAMGTVVTEILES